MEISEVLNCNGCLGSIYNPDSHCGGCDDLLNALNELIAYKEAEKQKCEYKIYIPADEGYPEIKGMFYECSCGSSYIEIEHAQEWSFCPYCGKSISSFETLSCISCKFAEWDGDSYYCEEKKGIYCGEEVTYANFDGCKYYFAR